MTLEMSMCRLHSHYRLEYLYHHLASTAAVDDLAGLTEEECFLLDGVGNDDTVRYAVYSTPGKLQWGVGLQVGETVLARIPEGRSREKGRCRPGSREEYSTAIIRWKGTMHGEHCFGLEIMVSYPGTRAS